MAAYTFHQASSCGQEFFIVTIVFSILSFTFVGLRFWALVYAGRKFTLDDFFTIFGFIGVGILTGTAFWGVLNGLGKHITELQLAQISILAKGYLLSEFGYLLATASVKMSMLCLYHRIYIAPSFRRWNFCAMGLMAVYFISFIPLFLTNCIPVSQHWDPKPDGWCRATIISDNATLAANLILDVIVLALPLPVLWSLAMSIRYKLTMTALFGFGIVTIALVIWRLVVTEKTRGSPDWPATVCQIGEIATLETMLGVMAVCIPTLGPLFNAYIKPVLVRVGITSNTPKPTKDAYLVTFGSLAKNKAARKWDEFNDSADRIVTRNNSIKLTPIAEGKVVSECTFEETHKENHGHEGIRVQTDIEAQYHQKKSG
ncbi:hypothetical protein F5Y09DRAFT_354852 [Xylaria sp. FL1042]|nr:hypothetical protein F5Y09DRAFT_354852 [Xylaria sp. FL1042]